MESFIILQTIQFEANGQTYTACYIGVRNGKGGNWWRCDVLDIYIAVSDGATQADVIAAFESILAAPQEDGV
jgi:hypothetical protein